jgi:hypothetical protein
MLLAAISGVSRRLLESPAPEKEFDIVQKELIIFVSAYLGACAARPSSP